MIKRIVLFRFHENIEISCRIKLLKHFNPGVEVYGLFGGSLSIFNDIKFKYKDILNELTFWDESDTELKWRSSDLAYQQWFSSYGNKLDFDFLHSIEWDLILTDSLDNLFSHIPKDAIGCTGLIPLHVIERQWFWTSDIPLRIEWLKFLHSIIKGFHYDGVPYAIQGPGIVLPRIFFENLEKISISRLANDELRIPIYAQLFNLQLIDNRLYSWFDPLRGETFNCNKIPISMDAIFNEITKVDGQRSFHPVTEKIKIEDIYKYTSKDTF